MQSDPAEWAQIPGATSASSEASNCSAARSDFRRPPRGLDWASSNAERNPPTRTEKQLHWHRLRQRPKNWPVRQVNGKNPDSLWWERKTPLLATVCIAFNSQLTRIHFLFFFLFRSLHTAQEASMRHSTAERSNNIRNGATVLVWFWGSEACEPYWPSGSWEKSAKSVWQSPFNPFFPNYAPFNPFFPNSDASQGLRQIRETL